MKSNYLETLEKLQKALTMFDMSFSVSNKIFRLAIVTEIIDTAFLFEQLYESWSENLPYGEGPDADVNFAYWRKLSSWETLLDSAKQNACIDDFPFDMGNGLTSDRINGNRRKSYLKTVNGVLRRSKYAGKEATSAFVKTINSDETHMMTFGNMVFEALTPLLLVFGKIDDLLSYPSQELFLNFFEMQKVRFYNQWLANKQRVEEILQEDLSKKRKCNRLYALKDELWKNLYESSFLDTLKESINIYDIEDYKRDNPDTEKNENEIREVLALAELVDSDNKPYKEKVGKYIFEHRKSLSSDDICTFFLYLDAIPEILNQIERLKENSFDEENINHTLVANNHSDKEHEESVVDAIHELTGVVKESLKTPKQQFTVYPQPGSTANLGCDQKNSDFKTYLPGTDASEEQSMLESK